MYLFANIKKQTDGHKLLNISIGGGDREEEGGDEFFKDAFNE